jgi:hypothetical protein
MAGLVPAINVLHAAKGLDSTQGVGGHALVPFGAEAGMTMQSLRLSRCFTGPAA